MKRWSHNEIEKYKSMLLYNFVLTSRAVQTIFWHDKTSAGTFPAAWHFKLQILACVTAICTMFKIAPFIAEISRFSLSAWFLHCDIGRTELLYWLNAYAFYIFYVSQDISARFIWPENKHIDRKKQFLQNNQTVINAKTIEEWWYHFSFDQRSIFFTHGT